MKTTSICQYGLALALAAVTVTGCSGGGGGGGGGSTAPITKQTVENYPVTGVLKETDGYAMPGTVTLTAADKNGPVKLYSDKTGGQEITSVTAADDGLVSFYVAGTAVPPITIKAAGSTSVANHVASSTRFTIDRPGTTNFTINMIDLDVPSAGVDPTIQGSTLGDVDDTLGTPFNLQMTSTQVTIPTGTIFKDAAGNNLKGTVKASLTAFASSTATTPLIDPNIFDTTLYDPENELLPTAVLQDSDLENFPGGMNNINTPSGTGYFVTAGFVAVNVTDASGNHAKSLSTGGTFDIRLDVPAGTVNPNTDSLLVAGDTIPVFTYDEVNMVWIPEAMGLVQLDPVTGGLYVKHTANHFSFWNLGWIVTGTSTSCTATMNLLSDAIAMQLNLKATISTKNHIKGKNVLLTGIKPAGDTTVTANNVPNLLLDIVLTDTLKNVIWSKAGVNWCLAPITASYTAPVSKKAVPVTVKVTEYCSQDPTLSQVVPSTPTQATKAVKNVAGRIPAVASMPIAFGITDATGTSILNLVPGSYNISAYDRRTATYFPAPPVATSVPLNRNTVAAATPLTVSINIPVTCKTITGATTGSTGYSF